MLVKNLANTHRNGTPHGVSIVAEFTCSYNTLDIPNGFTPESNNLWKDQTLRIAVFLTTSEEAVHNLKWKAGRSGKCSTNEALKRYFNNHGFNEVSHRGSGARLYPEEIYSWIHNNAKENYPQYNDRCLAFVSSLQQFQVTDNAGNFSGEVSRRVAGKKPNQTEMEHRYWCGSKNVREGALRRCRKEIMP